MNLLFNQTDFSGGLDLEFDSTQLPVSSYMFLANGRNRRNSVVPNKANVKLDAPLGNKQGLYAAGSILLLFSSGNAFYWDTTTNAGFQPIIGWNTLDALVERIYCSLMPISASQLNFNATAAGSVTGTLAFNNSISRTPACALVTDGLAQPQLIFPNATWRVAQIYSAWGVNNPEYVPKGVLPVVSGSKAYMVSPDRQSIYQSVSGRYLDFVVNRLNTGLSGGDASTVSKSVDYNLITAILPSANGGLTVSTLYATYSITPDFTQTIFGEPYLADAQLFPVGALNQFCFVDLLGDTAFITQSGIHSFNFTQQVRFESNNFPLGAKIQKLLVQPQTDSVATEFDDYALFACNTIYGQVVLVYDRIRKVFAGIDLNFGHVKQFAVVKANGVRRLFYITWDNEVYEAYASNSRAVCRYYSGEYSEKTAGVLHQISAVHASFNNVRGSFAAQLTYLADRVPIETAIRNLVGQNAPDPVPPIPLPFPPAKSAATADFALKAGSSSNKSGLLVEWQGEGDLVGVTFEGKPSPSIGKQTLLAAANTPTKVVFFADAGSRNALIITALVPTLVAVIPNQAYTIVGTADGGEGLVTNDVIIPKTDHITVTGKLFLEYDYATLQQLLTLKPDHFVAGGDMLYDNGSADDLVRGRALYKDFIPQWSPVAGNHDLDTGSGANFYSMTPSQRYYSKVVGNMEFFFIDGGYTTGGSALNPITHMPTGPCIDLWGNTVGSLQYQWIQQLLALSTAKFKIAVMHWPPYSDGNYSPGYIPLRWDFAALGFHLVLSGHDHNYQRFNINDLPYVVAGWTSTNRYPVTPLNSLISSSDQGYLVLQSDEFNLVGNATKMDGTILDSFSVSI